MPFPSTLFPDVALPKWFAPHRLEDADNLYSMLNPGVRLHIKGGVTDHEGQGGMEWRGLAGLGIYSIGSSRYELDCSRVLASPGYADCHWGLYLSSLTQINMIGGYTGKRLGARHIGVSYNSCNGLIEFWYFDWTTGRQVVGSHATGSTAMSFALAREGAGSFEGFYNLGAGWQSLGTFSLSGDVIPLQPLIGYVVLSSMPTPKEFTWDISAFRQIAGSYGLDYRTDAPSDPFDSDRGLIKKFYQEEPPGTAGETYSVSGGKGSLWDGPWPYRPRTGLVTPWVFFPGSNLSVEADLELAVHTGTGSVLWYINIVDAIKNGRQEQLQEGHSNIGDRMCLGIWRDYSSWLRIVWQGPNGSFWTQSSDIVGGIYRAKVKLTRVGSVWSASYDVGAGFVSLGTPWTDSSGVLEWCRLLLEEGEWGAYGNGMDNNIYDLQVSGDFNASGEWPAGGSMAEVYQ